MINIIRKEDCCGCGACYDVCPRSAIIWEEDYEGFAYPQIDSEKCVNCGLCNKVCPIENSDVINARNSNIRPKVLAAYHLDEDIRLTSTSGGAFWGLSEEWLKRGGYVAGAIFEENFHIKHIVTNDFAELKRIKGSKYAQSDSRGIFKQIRKLLDGDKLVMATGLPCQMAALRQFSRKDYDNLIVVDLICNSVTSQMFFQLYLKDLEKKYNSQVINYHPKNKELGGWHNFAFKASFKNGKTYINSAGKDYYCNISYGTNLLSRFSCYACRYKHFPQPSDITIGDFWGIENIDSSWDSPNGVSKIILNTNKGKSYFEGLDCFASKEFDAGTAIFNNPSSWSMIKPVEWCDLSERARLVDDLHKHSLDYCMYKYIFKKPTLKNRVCNYLKILCQLCHIQNITK